MNASLTNFFTSWGETEADKRLTMLTTALHPDAQYTDPRTPETLTNLPAIADYISQFSANAPGWTARIVASSQVAQTHRLTVAFGGTGPDGADIVQHGQYFARLNAAGQITDMTGFAGLGTPE